jgi:CRP-like cAMP-binding protein
VLYPGAGSRIEITQEELGLLAGVSRAVANRSLAELEDEGLIRAEHGEIRVLDLAALKTY